MGGLRITNLRIETGAITGVEAEALDGTRDSEVSEIKVDVLDGTHAGELTSTIVTLLTCLDALAGERHWSRKPRAIAHVTLQLAALFDAWTGDKGWRNAYVGKFRHLIGGTWPYMQQQLAAAQAQGGNSISPAHMAAEEFGSAYYEGDWWVRYAPDLEPEAAAHNN